MKHLDHNYFSGESVITIVNTDGKIWHHESVIIEIMQTIARGDPLVRLHMNGEGSCLRYLGLYDLLDRICHTTGWPKNKIEIETANFLEHHDQYLIRHVHQDYELKGTHHQWSRLPDDTKRWNEDFKHFGHFVGHSNRHRLHMASDLFTRHRECSLQTYHARVTEPYHRPHLGLEDLLFHGASQDEIDRAMALFRHGPITLDIPASQEVIAVPHIVGGLIPYYPQFFVEIVNQAYFSGKTFYVDEKIWRPVSMRTPFLVQGPQNYIKNLRRLGFETFHEFWDEGYSEDPADCQPRAIINIIDELARLTVSDLKDIYQRMLPILDHNRQHLEKLNSHDFNRVFQS